MMAVRIWDEGEFERLPDKRQRKKRHRLYCGVGLCPVMVEGNKGRKVLKALRKHRAEAHPDVYR